jgi:hypothetical protein
MQDCSFCDALADMVMIALMKSPLEVWVVAGYFEERKDSNRGIKFWE